MSSIRVTNIEAKADASSPTIDEKVKVTDSQGRVLMQVDGKTSGITTVGINTTGRFVMSPHSAGWDLGVTSGNIAPHYQTNFTLYNGQIGSGGTVIGDTRPIICNENFTNTNGNSVVCGSNGQWEPLGNCTAGE